MDELCDVYYDCLSSVKALHPINVMRGLCVDAVILFELGIFRLK